MKTLNVNIYRYSDYRLIIRKIIEEEKSNNPSYSSIRLARAIGIQQPYLSKVLNGHAHLSDDHLFLFCRYFNLSEEDEEYLSHLLDFARSGLASRQKALRKKIAAIQFSHRRVEKVVSAKYLQSEAAEPLLGYYLDVDLALVHMHLSIPEFSRNSAEIAKRMGISDARLKSLLKTLEQLGVVARDPKTGEFKITQEKFILNQESPLSDANHILLRMRSAQHMASVPKKDRWAFSLTFSADEKTRVYIHELFLQCLQQAESAISAAPSEEVYQMNFDLFPWRVG